MKLFSWNVNGIRAVLNKGEFTKFIETYNPDIICLQETKAQRGQVALDLPQFYEHFGSQKGLFWHRHIFKATSPELS